MDRALDTLDWTGKTSHIFLHETLEISFIHKHIFKNPERNLFWHTFLGQCYEPKYINNFPCSKWETIAENNSVLHLLLQHWRDELVIKRFVFGINHGSGASDQIKWTSQLCANGL